MQPSLYYPFNAILNLRARLYLLVGQISTSTTTLERQIRTRSVDHDY